MSTNENPTPELITAAKLAALLNLSVRSIWRLRSAGKLPQPVRLGGAVRWRLQDVLRWIEAGCHKPGGLGVSSNKSQSQ